MIKWKGRKVYPAIVTVKIRKAVNYVINIKNYVMVNGQNLFTFVKIKIAINYPGSFL